MIQKHALSLPCVDENVRSIRRLMLRLRYTARYQQAAAHYAAAREVNTADCQRRVALLIQDKKGLNLVRRLLSALDYRLLYTTKHAFELAYFYKTIPDLCRVSVVVPVYNCQDYLAECLDSVLAQTWHNLEIICVDDGSTDGSWEILQRYQKQDKRIRLYQNTQNCGISMVRNVGISHCRSEYVLFVDSDDWLPKDAVEKLYRAMIVPGVDWVCGAADVGEASESDRAEKQSKEQFMKKFYRPTGLYGVPADVGRYIYISTWAKLYKLSIILHNHLVFPDHLIHEDQSWIWEYGVHCRYQFFINDSVYVYRINHASLTHASGLQRSFLPDLLRVHLGLYRRLSHVRNIKMYQAYLARFLCTVLWFSAEKDRFQVRDSTSVLFRRYMRLNPAFRQYVFPGLKELNQAVPLACIAVMNIGDGQPSVVLETSAGQVGYPETMKTPEGQGGVVYDFPHQISFTVVARGRGRLQITCHGRELGPGQKADILLKSFRVNGQKVLKQAVFLPNGQSYEYHRSVEDSERLFITMKYEAGLHAYEDLRQIFPTFRLTSDDGSVLYVKEANL